jgi:hypothetical protein
MKTSELTGALLDYWVARAEGLNPAAVIDYGREVYAENYGKGFEVSRYSTDWSQGGPIIERERIFMEPQNYNPPRWSATNPKANGWAVEYGPTPWWPPCAPTWPASSGMRCRTWKVVRDVWTAF